MNEFWRPIRFDIFGAKKHGAFSGTQYALVFSVDDCTVTVICVCKTLKVLLCDQKSDWKCAALSQILFHWISCSRLDGGNEKESNDRDERERRDERGKQYPWQRHRWCLPSTTFRWSWCEMMKWVSDSVTVENGSTTFSCVWQAKLPAFASHQIIVLYAGRVRSNVICSGSDRKF